MKGVSSGAHDPDHEPEVGRVGEVEADLGEDEDGGRNDGHRGRAQLEDAHWRSASGKYPVNDVDGGREGVVHTHKYWQRNS